MTRETKVGLAVAGSFLSLVTVVVAARMSQPELPAQSSSADARSRSAKDSSERVVPDKNSSPRNEKPRTSAGTNGPSATVIPAGGLLSPNPAVAQANSEQTNSKQGVAPPPMPPPPLSLNQAVTEGNTLNDPSKQTDATLASADANARAAAAKLAADRLKASRLQAQIDKDNRNVTSAVPEAIAAVSPAAALVSGLPIGADKNLLVAEAVPAPPPAPPALPNATTVAPPVAPPPASPSPMPSAVPMPQQVAIPMPSPTPDAVPPPNATTKINLPEAPAAVPPVPPASSQSPAPAPVAPPAPAGPPVTPPPVSITKNNGPGDPAPAPVTNPSPIAATSGVSAVPNSPPPLGAPPPAAISAIPVRSQAPAGQADVAVYDVMTDQVLAGETSFADVSKRVYKSEKYASALLKYNREQAQVDPDLKRDPPVLRQGTKLYVPISPKVLERPEYSGPAAQSVSPPAPVQVGTPMPLSSSPGNPATANAPPPGTRVAAGGPDGNGNYRVRDGGEHIFEIARSVYGTGDRWAEIYRLNPGLNPSVPIPAGTVLKLPPSSGR